MGLFKSLKKKFGSKSPEPSTKSQASSSQSPSTTTKQTPTATSSTAKPAAAGSAANANASSTSSTQATKTSSSNAAKSESKRQPKIAIVYYSTWGHIRTLALREKAGIEAAGGSVDLYQIPETLPKEVLTAMYAAPKSDDPVITPEKFAEYDGLLFGIPTRYGTQSSQWRAFWDATGGLWAKAALDGKYAGMFTSTGSPNSGGESTIFQSISTLAHHGLIFVPLGYSTTGTEIGNLEEVHGGSPWGAGTFAGPDGSRQPTELELTIAEKQGALFYKQVQRAV